MAYLLGFVWRYCTYPSWEGPSSPMKVHLLSPPRSIQSKIFLFIYNCQEELTCFKPISSTFCGGSGTSSRTNCWGARDRVHDRLLTFLKACDRAEHLDLAGRALVLAITRLTTPNASISPVIAKAHSKGITALQKIQSGYEATRTDLRALAELEDALENPRGMQGTSSPEKEAIRTILASVGGSLPRHAQDHLARSLGDEGDETSNLLLRKGLSPAGWYAISATATFTIVAGLSSLPSAITYSGNTWATALIPLAILALLVYLLYRRT